MVANGFKWICSERTPGAVSATKGNVTYNFYPISKSGSEATMKLYLEPDRHVLPHQGEISMPALQAVIDMMAESGLLQAPPPKPERFIDTQYLRAAGVE